MDTGSAYPYRRGFYLYKNTDYKNCPGTAAGIVEATKLIGFPESVLASEKAGVTWGNNIKGLLSPQLLTSDTHVCRMMIADTLGLSTTQTYRENLRGYVPGLVECLKINQALFQTQTINGNNYIRIGLRSTETSSLVRAGFLMSTDGNDF